jgi:pyridinium-3,5-biscarboxylic acid mononucleotide sulfurtransferase
VTDLAARTNSELSDQPASDQPGVGHRLANLDALRSELRSLGDIVVAFSGGADSAFVARLATDTLGAERVLCVTAVSSSLAPEELDDCRALAAEWGLRHLEVATDELADPSYAVNDGSRCYHCKASLMAALGPVVSAAGPAATVVLGVNLDDLADHRPGQAAASERGAVFPLVAAGFTKADVRAWSRRLGLRTWDKPAAACLASRVPYGTPVTFATLDSVARAESGLRALGFRQLRVRHYGETARIEVPADELASVVEQREAVCGAVHAAGYRYVTLDLDGFRSGNLNDSLGATGSPGPSTASTLISTDTMEGTK